MSPGWQSSASQIASRVENLTALTRTFPDRATDLFAKAEKNAKDKYTQLVEKAGK